MFRRYSLYSNEKILNTLKFNILPNYNISSGNDILVINKKLQAQRMY